mmetsp:Transcript_6275/g.15605  ORF Transcript_6275/g.15605 Transcript_6275/m.15605 type:complete len:387 (+) Transcript_6275:83-1243(+)
MDRCVDQFGLQPVPDAWKDSTHGRGSETAWKRYYNYRSRVEDIADVDKLSEDDDGYLDYKYLKEWQQEVELRSEEYMATDVEWHWTPKLGNLTWEDYEQLRSAEYYAHVWSPFAIPHAIELEHRYHGRARYRSFEFFTFWGYRLIDFEDESTIDSDRFKNICSNCYEDDVLRQDIIKESHMNNNTSSKIRKFLYGTDSDESKAITCSDMNLWLMLFASMGTTDPDLDTDPNDCDHGYAWCPSRDKEMKQKLYDLGASEGNDPRANPNGPIEDYYPSGCGWLKHRLLQITGNLGPVTQHYQPPTIKDAGGYDENYQLWMDRKAKYQAKVDRLKNDTEFMDRLIQRYQNPRDSMLVCMKWFKISSSSYDQDVNYDEACWSDSDSDDNM